MNARQLAILVLVAVVAACNTSRPTKPPEPVPLEIPVDPPESPFDTTGFEVETVAPNTVVPTGSSTQGQWSARVAWPTLAIHAALMPDKTVMTWGWRRQWNRSSNGDDPIHYQICKTWTDSWDSTQKLSAGHSSKWYGAGVTGNGLSYPITCPNPEDTDMFGAGHAHMPSGQPSAPARATRGMACITRSTTPTPTTRARTDGNPDLA
jgi:hypothetical protein